MGNIYNKPIERYIIKQTNVYAKCSDEKLICSNIIEVDCFDIQHKKDILNKIRNNDKINEECYYNMEKMIEYYLTHKNWDNKYKKTDYFFHQLYDCCIVNKNAINLKTNPNIRYMTVYIEKGYIEKL